MRIVIVGGAGFVGHHLAPAYKKQGHDVVCIDSLMINNLYAIDEYHDYLEERLDILDKEKIPLLRMDARDYHLLSRAVSRLNPDLIVHLAAIAHITVANKDPFTTFDHSLRTLENTLDIARSLECAVVYFSSSTVYGDFSQPIIDESESCTPKGIYGNLKLAGERMVISYNQTYGTPSVIIRPQALYGPRCVSGRVTQIFIERARAGLPIEIHGTGEEKHDFTYIQDLVNGMGLVAGLPFEKGLSRIYNLTGECATSLSELASIVTERYPTEIEYLPSDPEKPSRGTMSCKKIRELGYEPKYGIRRGMNRYMDWYDAEEHESRALLRQAGE